VNDLRAARFTPKQRRSVERRRVGLKRAAEQGCVLFNPVDEGYPDGSNSTGTFQCCQNCRVDEIAFLHIVESYALKMALAALILQLFISRVNR
jgi:hypothetical protein